jgi:hypothetical protein
VKKMTVLFSAVCMVLLSAPTRAHGCGDKLLHLNRNVQRQKVAASTPGSVLVFSRAKSLLENASSLNLDSALRHERHKLAIARTDTELSDALKFGTYDVIIVDIADVAMAQRAAATVRPEPLVVPVVSKDQRAQLEDAARRFVAVIKSPAKADKFVDAVDRAMDVKSARDRTKVVAAK